MEKTIKYLENGEYHYATVKDVGDLAKLKTDSKDDLVTAINELFITGGEASKKPDGYDELVDNVADAIQKQQQITDTITNMQQSAQLSDAEMQHMKQVQEEAHQDYIKALKEFNDAIAQANADALELDKKTDELKKNADDLNKKTNDLQDKLNETFTNVGNEVSAVHKQLDTESAGLHKELNDTKASLEETRKDLLNNTQEFGVVNSEVKELKDKMDRRIWSTDLDPVREQVNKNTTEVSQTKDELKNKADQSNLDLVTNSVENLSTQVKENAAGLKVSVKKDELGGDVARLLNDKTNLLLGTRNFSGDSWGNKTFWHEEAGYWKGLKVFSSTEIWFGLQYKYEVKQGQQYTFSFWARQKKDNSSAGIVLSESNKGDQGITTPYTRGVHIGTEWKRYSLTFQAESDGIIYPRVEQSVQGNKLYIAGYKLELGNVATPWEPNEADVAENIEHTESQFNVYSDQIAGIVKKQEKMGDTERQLDTRITETAEGLKQTSKDLQDANGKITEFKGQLESTAQGLKTEYEKYTNEAVGQISDSSLNLIHNSAFSSQDNQFESWQNISAKATVREDSNNLHWVELTQSGQGTDNPIGVTSNYFIVKQGKVTVAVDVKLGDKANLDNQNILLLELYDENRKRVDFTDVSVSQLGLSMSVLNDHNVHRGLYRLGIDRKDVKYMTVKAILHRNGDLWLTNFSARLSSIDDGGYTPNPDDVNHQILKMNTKIEEDAEHIALKANSVDVTRDIKSAVDGIQVGGRNLLQGTAKIEFPLNNNGGTQTIQKYDDETNYIQHTSNTPIDRMGPWWPLAPEVGQVYTLSADVCGNGYIQGEFHYEGGESGSLGRVNLTNDWQRISNTFRVNTISGNWVIYANNSTLLKIKHIKIEKGNVTTDWSPAPEDTSAEIKSAKDAAIQVASDQINLHVNELSTQFDDKLNKRVNEVKTASEKFTSDGIEQVVTKITNVKNDVDRLDQRVATNNGGGINLLRGTGSEWKTLTGSVWFCQTTGAGAVELGSFTTGDTVTYSITVRNNSQYAVRPEIVGFSDDNGTRSFNISGTESVQPGETKTVSVSATVAENTVKIIGWLISSGSEPTFSVDAKNEKLERGSVATPWSPNPQDAKTYTDSQIVNTNKKIDTQTLDSANIDQMKTQGHYFVHNLTGNPIGGWVYVDVTGNNNDRVRQDVYADQNNQHKYRSWNGSRWSDWEQGAYLSDVNSLKTEVTASVKNLGDRVTTEVNSITSKVNSNNGGGINLLQGTAKIEFPLNNNGGTQTIQKYDDETNYIQHTSNTPIDRMGPWLPLAPEVGQVYTLSADVCGNGYIQGEFHYEGGESGSLGRVNLTNDWQRISNTFRVNTISGNWVIYANNSTLLKVKHVKIERGSVATPWSPAPEDTAEAIKTLNTKWDVANGQIQGKVTATDVNNILNGKGYATQSWAQTMFTMKSDAITLQAVRDNITNGIQNQINDTRNQVKGLQNQFNTQTGINLLKGTADFSGSWFNKDANGWSIMSGWQAPFSENTSAMNNNVVYVKNGSAWNGLGQAVQLNPGEYTFSMWLWPDLSGKESLSIYAGDGQYGGTATLSCGYTYSASQPQKQWVLAKLYLNVTKGGVVAIRPELNQDTGKMYVASYMLQRGHVENPTWAPNPGDLSPSNIVSAINLTPDDIKLASKKINIDGNTSISGTLNVPTVRLQGKSGQIDLSGDSGISIKDSSDGKVDIGASGVNIFSGMQTVNTDFADKSGFKLNVGSSGVEFSNVLHQTNGIMGAGQHEYGFLKIEPAVLPGTNTQETQYNAPAGIIGYVENMPDASLGPMSPGGFLALGSRTRKDTNVNSPVEDKTEIVYANKALNGWDQGLTIRSQFFIKPQDADHGIRSAWVSWSAWDHGEKYPAFVNDSGAWGGICFPRSGRVTLFDSGGQYYTPDRSTGVGPYDNYWTKGQ